MTNRKGEIEMRFLSNGTKVGLMIMLAAGIAMALIVLVSKPIPDPVALVFFAGVVISIVSAFAGKGRRPILA